MTSPLPKEQRLLLSFATARLKVEHIGEKMLTLLNTSILTTFGQFDYQPITLETARSMVSSGDFESAIGHQATAEILTELLQVPVAVNRVNYSQGVNEKAIVFKLRGRAPEGAILTREQIDAIGYDFGLLERIK